MRRGRCGCAGQFLGLALDISVPHPYSQLIKPSRMPCIHTQLAIELQHLGCVPHHLVWSPQIFAGVNAAILRRSSTNPDQANKLVDILSILSLRDSQCDHLWEKELSVEVVG